MEETRMKIEAKTEEIKGGSEERVEAKAIQGNQENNDDNEARERRGGYLTERGEGFLRWAAKQTEEITETKLEEVEQGRELSKLL